MKRNTIEMAEWPARRILLAVCAPAAALTLSEILFRELYDHWLIGTGFGGNHLYYSTPLIFMILGGVCFGLVLSSPVAKITLAIASIVVGFFLVVQFRGSHRWMGFYDLTEDSRTMFYIGWVVALVLGAIAARWIETRVLEATCFVVLLFATAFCWIHAMVGLNIMTFVPYTRHFGVTSLLIVVASGSFYDNMREGGAWRTS